MQNFLKTAGILITLMCCMSLHASRLTSDQVNIVSEKESMTNDKMIFTDYLLKSGSYGFYVEFASNREQPYLFVSDKRLITRPVQRGEGLVYSLAGADLVRIEDYLYFQSSNGDLLEMTDWQLFELPGLIEEVHFQESFGDSDKVAPPLHPSQNDYDVTKYTLDMEIDPDSRFLSADVTIQSDSLIDNLQTVAFDFADADFSGQSLTISSITTETSFDLSPFTSIDRSNDWLLINYPNEIQPDQDESFSVIISYSGSPGPGQGAFGLETYNRDVRSNGDPVVYSFSEPYGARTWWPGKDVTNDRALLDFIITVPNEYEAIANGRLVSAIPVLGNQTRWFWSHGYPIAPYLIAFCVSDYEYVGGTYAGLNGSAAMEVGHYIFSESSDDRGAFEDTIDVMETFSELFGEYPFLDEKYVTMTWGGGFGMEHTTVTSTNQNDLRSSNGSGFSRRNVHELAHHWFGNYVTPESFDHLWLNEGFATYCEALEREQRLGTAAYFSSIDGFINSRLTNGTPIVNPNADRFDTGLVYRKAALVLHMLRHVMGDEDFFQATRNYLTNNAYGIVNTEIFESEMEAVEGRQLDWFFDQWIYGTQVPEYEFIWQVDGNNLEVFIDQTVLFNGYPFFEMPIDLLVEFEDGSSELFVVENTERAQTFIIPTGSRTVSDVTFDPDNWIYKLGVEEPAKPNAPVLQSVLNSQNILTISWIISGATHDGFRLQKSANGSDWQTILDESQLDSTARSVTVSSENGFGIWRTRSTANGVASDPSDPYPVNFKSEVPGDILIVDGYDRYDSQKPPSLTNLAEYQIYTRIHGLALQPIMLPFETCSNEFILNSGLNLSNYDAVIWHCSEESTADDPFNATERDVVRAYLQSGGNLFLSGSEIGWAHGRAQSADFDQDFYNNFLKATFVTDDSANYDLSGTSGQLFEGLSFETDSTGAITYFADFPDVIAASDGSFSVLEYGSGQTAAVAFEGLFSGGNSQGRVVYLGFPFETIVDETDRTEVLLRSLEYFGFDIPESEPGDRFMLY